MFYDGVNQLPKNSKMDDLLSKDTEYSYRVWQCQRNNFGQRFPSVGEDRTFQVLT